MQHDDQLYFLIGFGDGLGDFPLGIGGSDWKVGQFITALWGEKVGESDELAPIFWGLCMFWKWGISAVSRTDQTADGIGFDSDHRFVLPLFRKENPATQDLFRGVVLVVGFAVDFEGEVAGEGLQRHDPVAV